MNDQDVLRRAAEHAFEYLGALETRSVAATAGLEDLRTRLARPLPEAGTPAAQVLDELVADATPGIDCSRRRSSR